MTAVAFASVNLELRAQRHRIDLVQGKGQIRSVIGTSGLTQEADTRTRTALNQGGSRSPRTQTILSHRLPGHLQRALEVGLPSPDRVPPSGGVTSSEEPD